MIGIVNTRFGNIYAIQNIYTELGIKCIGINDSKSLNNIEKLIIPGIGNFDSVINSLQSSNLFQKINNLVSNHYMPVLGICIGMHIFYEKSDEGKKSGFGWIRGNISKMNRENLKYPHMGWNKIKKTQDNKLFSNIEDLSEFYFLHSYSNKSIMSNELVLSKTFYGEDFISAINYKNIYGVQFHPEKSHSNGMKILSNFAKICA